jgi:hypothetical protein
MMTAVLMLMILLGMASSSIAEPPPPAQNYHGQIDLVSTWEQSMRFFVRAQRLNLFATGESRGLMLEAFFKKAYLSVAYTTMTCPPGVEGRCGKVNFVTADITGLR